LIDADLKNFGDEGEVSATVFARDDARWKDSERFWRDEGGIDETVLRGRAKRVRTKRPKSRLRSKRREGKES